MYYLIEHNRTTKKTDCSEYSDCQKAWFACFYKEQRYALANKNEMEVVVFEADSLEDLKQTHSRYFVESEKNLEMADIVIGVGAISLVALAVYLLTKKS